MDQHDREATSFISSPTASDFCGRASATGFRHLYLYDVSGKMLKQLTHGDWEVESLDGVDEGSQLVYFTSTQKSPIERQLYRVSLQATIPNR